MSNISSNFTITSISSEFTTASIGSFPTFLEVPNANLRQRKTPLSSSIENTSTWYAASSPWVNFISGSSQEEED